MPKILLIHTGGTLGMGDDDGTAPLSPGTLQDKLLQTVPEMGHIAQVDVRVICNLDSSDVGPHIWGALAECIEQQNDAYDGFVIIHGTDTMSFTASALAFALRGLDKPVVLTGAQRPLASVRSDARRNLTDAVSVASMGLCEVSICFDGLLLRGCTSTKSSSHDYRAFESPGTPPLARLGVDINIFEHRRIPTQAFECLPAFDPNIAVVTVFPGMSSTMLEASLSAQDTLKGVVLVAFGLGNVPMEQDPVASALKPIIDRGVDVLAISQSVGTIDLGAYQNSVALKEMGVIPGGAMTLEAATTKLMHALANYPDPVKRKRYLLWNVAGER